MEHIKREDVEEILTVIQTRMFIKKCKEIEKQSSENVQLISSHDIPSTSINKKWAEVFDIPWKEFLRATSKELEQNIKPSAAKEERIYEKSVRR